MRRVNYKEGNESQDNTSPYRKLYQQFGAVCGNDIVPSKNKSAIVTARSNLKIPPCQKKKIIVMIDRNLITPNRS
jgi:hypothetical protein